MAEPRTINDLFKQSMERFGSNVVMRFKRDRQWHDITGAALRERVWNVALALDREGVAPGDRVALLAESCPEWSLTDYAILATGAVNVPIYPTQTVDQVAYILRDSGARTLFVSNVRQLKRVRGALDGFKAKERPRVILFEAPKEGGLEEGMTTLGDLEGIGAAERAARPGRFEEIAARAEPEDLATIIYTSGTTGEPKGVMLTHRNLVSNALSSGSVFELRPDDSALSFLPLSHVFERTVLYIYLSFGVQINYARGVETVAEDIKEVRPTVVTAVPRLFEKIYATINKRAAEATPFQQKIFNRAIEVGREVAVRRDRGQRVPVRMALEHRVLDAQGRPIEGLRAAGVPIIGTSPGDINRAGDRELFKQILDQLGASALAERGRSGVVRQDPRPRTRARSRRLGALESAGDARHQADVHDRLVVRPEKLERAPEVAGRWLGGLRVHRARGKHPSSHAGRRWPEARCCSAPARGSVEICASD